MASMTAKMTKEKETTNSIRYKETDDSPAMGAMGTLYLTKLGIKAVLGAESVPNAITVTVEVE